MKAQFCFQRQLQKDISKFLFSKVGRDSPGFVDIRFPSKEVTGTKYVDRNESSDTDGYIKKNMCGIYNVDQWIFSPLQIAGRWKHSVKLPSSEEANTQTSWFGGYYKFVVIPQLRFKAFQNTTFFPLSSPFVRPSQLWYHIFSSTWWLRPHKPHIFLPVSPVSPLSPLPSTSTLSHPSPHLRFQEPYSFSV